MTFPTCDLALARFTRSNAERNDIRRRIKSEPSPHLTIIAFGLSPFVVGAVINLLRAFQ